MSNEYNQSVATMLRTLADYISMADGNVKLRIGIKFKIKNNPVVSIPVQPVDKFSAALGSWASKKIIAVIKDYQSKTGKDDGQDLLEYFTEAQKFLQGVDKRPKV